MREFPPKERPYSEIQGNFKHAPDSVFGWTPPANAFADIRTPEYHSQVRTNQFGFRWTTWDSLATCRVMVIGDSFVAGHAVDRDSLFWQVAARETGCAIAGVGVPGYSTDQELLLLRKYARVLKPTAVVLSFYDNDVWCNREATCEGRTKPRFALQDGHLVATTEPSAPAEHPSLRTISRDTLPTAQPADSVRPSPALRVKRWLEYHSRLYSLTRRALLHSEVPLRSALDVAPLANEFRVYHVPYDPDIREAWDVTDALIGAIATEALAAGATQFLLMHIPLRASVQDAEWRQAAVAWHMGDDWEPGAVTTELRHICATRQLECVFTEPALRASATPGYFRSDLHLTPTGHRVVGHALAEALKHTGAGRKPGS